MASDEMNKADIRYMAAAIRFARRNLGLTGTNPSVGCLIVRDDGKGPRIVGRGITALGGRPHAEAQALDEAGEFAKGATAYVTLEPCAHHGRTSPCAEALIAAGITRVVGAASDPDERVSGKGYALLRKAGVEVVENVLARQAADMLRGYLIRCEKKRPEVILKVALSSDGMIGIPGRGQVQITGPISNGQVHIMRAEADAILIGINTALSDDPVLTCRLPGLENRSPIRIVLDNKMRLPLNSTLVSSASKVPLIMPSSGGYLTERREAYINAGVQFQAVELFEDEIALPEFLEDLAARGISTLMVEGGAKTIKAFLREDLVDRICLFIGANPIGGQGLASALTQETIPNGFHMVRHDCFGDDEYYEYIKEF